MNNTVYQFEEKILLQSGHGCIGDRAIGVIALLVMIWWSVKLRNKLKEIKIVNELMKIYVDDVNGIYHPVEIGMEYVDGRLKFNESKAVVDIDIPADNKTMDIVKDVANSIDEMIVMTTHVPSNCEDNKVPTLDVKIKYGWTSLRIRYSRNSMRNRLKAD